MMCFVFHFGMFHAFIKIFAGGTELFAVLDITEHEIIQELVKMVLQLPA